MNKIFVFLSALIVVLTSCKQHECPVEPDSCENASSVIIDLDIFESGPKYPFQFISAEVEGNCMNAVVTYSGCGDSEFTAVGNGAYTLSEPPQTFLRLSFDDPGECDAVFTDTLKFNLTPVRGDFQRGPILINLEGWDSLLEYNW